MNTRTLTTTLPADTLYVSGTVNGVATIWTNTEGQTWETVAERSPTDVYVVALTIINALGTATQTGFTLYYGLHLVTDRTQADVDRVDYLNSLWDPDDGIFYGTPEEEAEWRSDLKGTYNATDLNRVGAAMNYVAERLVAHGFIVSIAPKTDWTEQDWPTPSTMERYLADLAELRGKFALMESTPAVPEDMERLTYEEANDIEKILEDIDRLLTYTAQAWFYSGDLFSGEV